MTGVGFARAIVLLSAGLVTACADCERDPSQVSGLGCAIYNEEAGIYREDDAVIQREIASLEARAETLQADAERLNAEASKLAGQRQRAVRRLATLKSQTAALAANLANLHDRENADRAELARLRDQERRVSRQVIDASESGTNSGELARLEAEKAALESEIEQLLAVS